MGERSNVQKVRDGPLELGQAGSAEMVDNFRQLVDLAFTPPSADEDSLGRQMHQEE